jgi:hypothetical protein
LVAVGAKAIPNTKQDVSIWLLAVVALHGIVLLLFRG